MAVISLLFHYSWNSLSACFNYSKLGCFFELTILHWNCEPPLPCKSSSIRLNLPLSCITLFHIFASVLRNMNTFRCNIHGEYLGCYPLFMCILVSNYQCFVLDGVLTQHRETNQDLKFNTSNTCTLYNLICDL